MTILMEPNRLPIGSQEELTDTLQLLLDKYLAVLMSNHGDGWGKDEEDTVRQVRDVLTRAGHAPDLSYEVRSHLDYPTFSK